MPSDINARVRATRPAPRVTAALSLMLIALGLSGCDLDLANPTVLTAEEVDPQLLVNGAIESWMSGWNTGVLSEWYASDEAIAISGASAAQRTLDETGDLTGVTTYFSGFALAELIDAREETRIAMRRAEALLTAATDEAQETRALTGLQRARVYNAWFVSGLARRRAAQPIEPGGQTLTQEEQYVHALGLFTEAVSAAPAPNDSLRVNALAGSARLQWTLGRESRNSERLRAAIAAATEVLSLDPTLMWALEWPFGYITDWYITRFESALPGPGYENIPIPANNTAEPSGDMFIDADGLWLIIAESHLRLGELGPAKTALEATPLLRTNHVGLAGRDPEGPALTAEQVSAYVTPLTETDVQHVIDELWRENFYLRGERAISNAGTLIFPIPLPPNVLEQP